MCPARGAAVRGRGCACPSLRLQEPGDAAAGSHQAGCPAPAGGALQPRRPCGQHLLFSRTGFPVVALAAVVCGAAACSCRRTVSVAVACRLPLLMQAFCLLEGSRLRLLQGMICSDVQYLSIPSGWDGAATETATISLRCRIHGRVCTWPMPSSLYV